MTRRPEASARKKLATRLHFAAIHLSRRLKRDDDSDGLSVAQLSVISTLVLNGPMTLSALAEAEQVRPPTMTRLVQRLESDGYLIRTQSRTDARVSVIKHASKGWIALEKAAERRATLLADALSGMNREDLEMLERAVELMERLGR